MNEINYNKLVRDRIPEIIAKTGKEADFSFAGKQEFTALLNAKLSEEVQEFLESGDVSELADILEVVYALAENINCTREQLEDIRKEKARRCGAFHDRIFLKAVRSKEKIE